MEGKTKQITDLSKGRSLWHKFTNDYSVILITAAVVVFATILSGETFMTLRNWLNILRSNSVIGVLALGMTFVIIAGEIDLSVGSGLVAVGAIVLGVLNASGSVALAVAAGIAVGAGFGFGTGFIVTKGRVPSFIVTLGLMYIYRSVAMYFMSGGGFTGEVKEYQLISNYNINDLVPLPIIYFAIIAFAYYYLSKHTKLGRHIYAVGSNKKATRLSGINVDKVKILTFVIMGLSIAFSAIIESSRMNSINASSSGTAYEMNAIAMAVVGGASMAGGKGTIIGTIFGILIIGILNNILTLLGVDPFLVNAVKGVIVILAVLFQRKEVEQ
jgi:ribose transport system permease protein